MELLNPALTSDTHTGNVSVPSNPLLPSAALARAGQNKQHVSRWCLLHHPATALVAPNKTAPLPFSRELPPWSDVPAVPCSPRVWDWPVPCGHQPRYSRGDVQPCSSRPLGGHCGETRVKSSPSAAGPSGKACFSSFLPARGELIFFMHLTAGSRPGSAWAQRQLSCCGCPVSKLGSVF